MARAIDAEGLAKKVNEEICRCDCVISTMFARRFKKLIDEQPTIEPEPIVRCRDCDVPHNKWTGCPKLNGLVPPDNFYCAFGVRRDSDGKDD